MFRTLRLALTAATTAFALLLPAGAAAGEVKIAVAANFTAAANDLAAAFTAATGHTAVLSFGSTGKLYTQIVSGAPFAVFLAADDKAPATAEAEGHAVAGSRFTYAIGKLVLYSTDPQLIDDKGAVLAGGTFDKLAIANPTTAPYGEAAVAVLKQRGLYETLAPKLVQGDNIAQAYQFVVTGNAALGFVALAQVAKQTGGSKWLVPQEDYRPIRQDAVLTKAGETSDVAKAFLAFLKSAEARAIVEGYGYGVE